MIGSEFHSEEAWADGYCDSICSYSGGALDPSQSITSSGSWNSNDTALCTATSLSTGSSPSCAVTVSSSVVGLAGSASTQVGCSQAMEIWGKCINHLYASVLGPYCAAYNATGPAISQETQLEIADSAIVGFCGVGCIAEGLCESGIGAGACDAVPVLKLVCGLAGAADATVQLTLVEQILQNSATSHYIDSSQALGLASGEMLSGALTTGAGIVQGALRIGSSTADAATSGLVATEIAAESSSAATKLAKVASSSCIGLAFGATMLGIRVTPGTGTLPTMQTAQGNYCTSIHKLGATNAPNMNAGPGAPSGGTATTAAENAPATPNAPQSLVTEFHSCVTSGGDPSACVPAGLPLSSQAAAALADAMKDPNTANQILANIPDPNAVANAGKNGGLSSAMAAATPAGLPADFSKALTGLQEVIADNAASFALTDSASYKSGAATPSKNETMSVQVLDFTKAGDKSLSSKDAVLIFGKPGKSTLEGSGDIWHAGWKGSIFQIVSKRISHDSRLIAKLDWVTPLNRAVHGMKQLKDSIVNHVLALSTVTKSRIPASGTGLVKPAPAHVPAPTVKSAYPLILPANSL